LSCVAYLVLMEQWLFGFLVYQALTNCGVREGEITPINMLNLFIQDSNNLSFNSYIWDQGLQKARFLVTHCSETYNYVLLC